MNTKTMRLPPRRISTTSASSNNTTTTTTKRKEMESVLDAPHQSTSKTLKLSTPPHQAMSKPASASGLLAGYLAHEFLTRGTLLCQPWDPTARSAEEEAVTNQPDGEAKYEKLESYVQVADLLKTDGSQLAGIVNPTQLARILRCDVLATRGGAGVDTFGKGEITVLYNVGASIIVYSSSKGMTTGHAL